MWRPIETFKGEMFSLMTNGTPDTTEFVKYKGAIPSWARFYIPAEDLWTADLKALISAYTNGRDVCMCGEPLEGGGHDNHCPISAYDYHCIQPILDEQLTPKREIEDDDNPF